jgi:hypothetical protein
MPTSGLLYPGAAPQVSGNQITVERFVKNPSQVQRVLSDLTKERFVADFIFSRGDAQGGAVVYDQISENDLYADREPTEIAPGDEFPLVGDIQGDQLVAATTKRGSAFELTYEAVRRDQRDVLNRGLIKLRNSSVKKHDEVAMAALDGAPTRTAAAGAAWSGATGDQVLADIFGAVYSVEEADLGYTIDTVIINPAQVLNLLKKATIRDMLPRENPAINPVLSGRLANLAGIQNWIVTNRVASNKVFLLTSKIAGSIRDEVPFYSRTVDEPQRERYLIMAGRVSVPIITDPLAVFKLTGV